MSEVRYTPDGTYDASHSKELDTSDAGSSLDSVFLYDDGVGGDALRVSGPDGEIIFHKVDMSRDGITSIYRTTPTRFTSKGETAGMS